MLRGLPALDGKNTFRRRRAFEGNRNRPTRPVIAIPGIVKLLETTKPTAEKAVQILEKVGVLVETSGTLRGRTFAYKKYLDRFAPAPSWSDSASTSRRALRSLCVLLAT